MKIRGSRSPGLYLNSPGLCFLEGGIVLAIIYLLDKETLIKIYELRKELIEQHGDCRIEDLMKHDSYKRIGRRTKQVKWGKWFE